MTDREQPYIVSSSPHAHSGSSVRGIMLDVIIAMIPAIVVALMFFGMDALRLLVTCVASCLVAELLCRIAMKRDLAINDLSAVVTGILLAFNLPPALPTWMAVVGCITAIVIAKQLFGGLGYNPFNPALVARAVLLASRAPEMTSWSEWMVPGTDAVTSATPLALAADKASFVFDGPVALAMLIGKTNGCIGEVSALALIIGAIYLLHRRCISAHVCSKSSNWPWASIWPSLSTMMWSAWRSAALRCETTRQVALSPSPLGA